jgi:hypothetical protein
MIVLFIYYQYMIRFINFNIYLIYLLCIVIFSLCNIQFKEE